MSKIEELMKELSQMTTNEESAIDVFKSMDVLKAYAQRRTDYKAGDFLVRNADGKKRYKFPKGDDVAIVLDVFPEVRTGDDDTAMHGIVGCYHHEQKVVVSYAVDFRFYELAKTK